MELTLASLRSMREMEMEVGTLLKLLAALAKRPPLIHYHDGDDDDLIIIIVIVSFDLCRVQLSPQFCSDWLAALPAGSPLAQPFR